MDLDLKIEQYIDENYNLIIGRMPEEEHISTSAILIKNCDWSYQLLDDWYGLEEFIDKPYKPSPEEDHGATNGNGGKYFDQSGFHYLYDHYPQYREQTQVVPVRWMNNKGHYFQEGDFLVHFPGREPKKAKGMKKFLEVLNTNQKKIPFS
jgi:hypothetical protein